MLRPPRDVHLAGCAGGSEAEHPCEESGAPDVAELHDVAADDSADESDGSVTVTLVDGADYGLGTPKTANVTVADDDDPSVVLVDHDVGDDGLIEVSGLAQLPAERGRSACRAVAFGIPSVGRTWECNTDS
ncbi:hypothetical protein [Candidatus Poriferisodalis multihospitum]|uniref:hypothetical protein n=1 Tax=Candidatus Poriferisodalis multihospitum TaxID=2983191 RepID=UPI002B25AD9F|nr:hypothetical protein [Candidatus Poriferisodalis multihospitum]